jgi:hypothetical protein
VTKKIQLPNWATKNFQSLHEIFFGYYLKKFGCCPIKFSFAIDSGLIFTIDLSTKKISIAIFWSPI